MDSFKLILAAENAIKISFADSSSAGLKGQSSPAFYAALRQQILIQKWSWMRDALAGENSVTVFFDIEQTTYSAVKRAVQSCLNVAVDDAAAEQGKLITLPVSYGGDIGEDLSFVAQQSGLTIDEVIRYHQECIFTVTAVGFAPGFGYLKGLHKSLRLPRRSSPRIEVPKGAVAIAEDYTAIYPESSPGGWHIIGYCPEPLFDVSLPKPALFEVGQKVKFIATE